MPEECHEMLDTIIRAINLKVPEGRIVSDVETLHKIVGVRDRRVITSPNASPDS